jgi:hypothetical protein
MEWKMKMGRRREERRGSKVRWWPLSAAVVVTRLFTAPFLIRPASSFLPLNNTLRYTTARLDPDTMAPYDQFNTEVALKRTLFSSIDSIQFIQDGMAIIIAAAQTHVHRLRQPLLQQD